MADISSYSNSAPVTGDDKWIGTSSSGNTRNFKASDVANYVNGTAPGTVTTVSASSYTLLLTDSNVVMSAAAASTLSIPLNSSVPFPIGTTIVIMNKLSTSNIVTVSAAVGATVTYASTNNVITQNTARTIKKIGTDSWFLY